MDPDFEYEEYEEYGVEQEQYLVDDPLFRDGSGEPYDPNQYDSEEEAKSDHEELDSIDGKEEEFKDTFADFERMAKAYPHKISLDTDLADLYQKLHRIDGNKSQSEVILELLHALYAQLFRDTPILQPFPPLQFFSEQTNRIPHYEKKSLVGYILGYLCLSSTKKVSRERFQAIMQKVGERQQIQQTDLFRYARWWELVVLVA